MRIFIGPDIILSDLTEGPTLFAQSEIVVPIFKVLIRLTLCNHIISTIQLYNTVYILIMYVSC